MNIPQHGAGQKWGKQMWSNDKEKFPDIDAMFKEADELGFHVGLHNNAGTPEASGGDQAVSARVRREVGQVLYGQRDHDRLWRLVLAG